MRTFNDASYYTPAEIAARLGVDYRTVLSWIRAGKLPRRRIGRELWISEGEFQNIVEHGIK
jgi:excisionase family DNA binding protein